MVKKSTDSQPSTSRGTRASSTRKSQRRNKQETQNSSSDESENNRSNKITQYLTQPAVNVQLLITNLVKYALNHSCNKIPMKRADITKSLNIHQKQFNEVFEEANKLLRDVYGLEMCELPETKSTKLYITYSLVPLVSQLQIKSDERHEIQTLFLVLSYILMKSGEVLEGHLNNFVDELGIEQEEFTKDKEIFIKQQYLKRTKVEIEGRNELQIHYSWGPRATVEINKKDVVNAVAKIMNKNPQSFASQYHEIFGEAYGTQLDDSLAIN